MRTIEETEHLILESKIDHLQHWYLGNNAGKVLRLRMPDWNLPFFLTTSLEYARDYSDYGVYEVKLDTLINTAKICNFSNAADARKLHWPKLLIDLINSGKSDLNSIACDLHILAFHESGLLMQIQDTRQWRDVAKFFCDSLQEEDDIPFMQHSHWQDEADYDILLRMWMLVKKAGFSGFLHVEFGSLVLALFSLDFIDKINVLKIAR